MPSSGGVLTRNSNSSKIGGLQLSKDRGAIPKTQRSFRGLSSNGGSNHLPKKPSLGADLARIDSKRGLGGSRCSLRPCISISDDLSIDDTFVSEAEAPKKSAVDNFFANKTGAIRSRRKETSSQKKDENLKRLPPRRKTDGGATARREMEDLSKSEHDNRPPEKTHRDSLCRSDHVPRSATGNQQRRSSINSGKNGAPSRPIMDDLSKSEDDLTGTQEKARQRDPLSKSDHVPRSDATRRRDSINENIMSRNKEQPSIQGIYKIIDSMDNSSANPSANLAEGTAITATADTESPPTNNRKRLPRRSKTADSASNVTIIASANTSTSFGSGLRGIKNLIDQNNPREETAVKDGSSKEEVVKEEGIMKNDGSTPHDSSQSPERKNARSDDIGTNQRVSVQGIYKLMGSMNTNTNISTSVSPPMKEKGVAKKPSDASSRRLQVHQESLNRLASAKEDDDELLDRQQKRREASKDSRKKLLAESGALPVSVFESTREEQDLDAAGETGNGEEEELNNDYDTVATPKTATGPPPPPMKEAPPPPQRKNMARRPRNSLPQFVGGAPQKPATGSLKSAPTQMQVLLPATPMKSPAGLVVGAQNSDPTSIPIVTNTPQQHSNMPNLVTPQSMAMPVMPNNDFDSVATPCSIARPPAPPMADGPPPPPKRNMEVGDRWKSRQNNKLPTVPGQTGHNHVMETPSNAQKAPVLSSISPGGIVIEVNAPSGARRNMPSEPMTPSVMSRGGGDVTPGGYRNTPGSHRSTPGGKQFRGLPVPQTPVMRARRRSDISEVSNESYMRSPSMQPMSDISELTNGTYAGSVYGLTPTRETPRSQTGSAYGATPTRGTPRSQAEGGPRTPSLYASPGGAISELTPGGYSVGLYGDDDYKGSSDRERRHSSYSTHVMSTPSVPARCGSARNQLTPGTYGILLEEADEDGEAVVPSTPTLQSPAGVVSQLTPGTYGIDMLDEDNNNNNSEGYDNKKDSMQRQTRRASTGSSSQYPLFAHAPIPVTPTSGSISNE